MRTVILVGCMSWGCTGDSGPDDPLVVTLLAPKTAFEARYTAGGETITLRSHRVGSQVLSTIDDERGASITAMAVGALAISRQGVPQLIANRTRFENALRLAIPALRRLHQRLPPDVSGSSLYTSLSDQVMTLHRALTRTRRHLLQAWGAEAARELALSPDERARLASILLRDIQPFALDAKPDAEVSAMLGPRRFAQYAQHRASWLAQTGGGQ